MSWLCCLSRASLSFFSSCKSSDLSWRSYFSRKKPTTSKLHLLLCFFITSVTFILPFTFSCHSKYFHCFFFSFFLCFRYQTVFWVSASVLRSRSCSFSESYFHEVSMRLHAVTASCSSSRLYSVMWLLIP